MERSEERGNGGRVVGGRGTRHKRTGWGRGGGGWERMAEDRCMKRERSDGEKEGEMRKAGKGRRGGVCLWVSLFVKPTHC